VKQKTRQYIIFTIFFTASQAFGGQWMLSYALKQGLAQGTMLLGAKKIKNILKDPLVSETTLRPLRLSQEIVGFAEKIPMKTGASYRKFVNLDRDWIARRFWWWRRRLQPWRKLLNNPFRKIKSPSKEGAFLFIQEFHVQQ
jgi:hypothetical protein